MTGEHLAEIWPVKSESTPPSLERLEAIKAYALRVQSSVDDLHTLSQATPEILKPLGVGRGSGLFGRVMTTTRSWRGF